MKQLQRETEERNRLLLDEKHSIQRHYQQLKQRIKLYRSTQNQRLLQLSQSANACKKALNDKLDFARRVIQLNELCRKMETVTEQVLPFAAEREGEDLVPSSITANQEAGPHGGHGSKHHAGGRASQLASGGGHGHNASANITTGGSITAVPHQSTVWTHDGSTYVVPSDRLANFYRKYNKILLDNVAIAKEKERLQTENAQLQDLIQQYLNGTQISDEILADDNPLFVVNGR